VSFDDLSKEELVTILELIERSQKCSSTHGLRELILKARELFEAEFAVCGLVEAGLPHVNAFVNGNYPEEWVERYSSENLHLHDPVVRFHSRYAMTQLWSDVFRHYEDPGARALIRDAGDYGLKFGISGAIYVPVADQVAIFSFSGERDRFTSRHKRIIDILTMHFSRALVNSVKPVGAVPHWDVPSLGFQMR